METNQRLALLLGLVDLGKKGGGLAAESLVQDTARAAADNLCELQGINQ
jgi:hypothetical protein